jgi:hypothetical protein
MAKVTFTAFVSDIRGKVAGTVFSRNKGGAYVRTKVTPLNPQTSYQTGVRAFLTQCAQAWRNLTAAQRAAWNAAATTDAGSMKGGHKSPLSGSQYFNQLGRNLLEIGVALVSTPPSPTDVTNISSLSVAADNSDQTLTITYAPAVPADQKCIIYATGGQSAGINFFKGKYRKIGYIIAANVSPLSYEAEYIARFGTVPAAGEKISVMLKPIITASGKAGQAVTADCIVAA